MEGVRAIDINHLHLHFPPHGVRAIDIITDATTLAVVGMHSECPCYCLCCRALRIEPQPLQP
eukprot:3585484-Amphidinium_carterae.1